MFKYSSLKYDEFYSSEHCKRENEEIGRILRNVCSSGKIVLDLGAGTGLVSALLGNSYLVAQVEKDAEMRKQNKYPNFINKGAEEWIKYCRLNNVLYDNVVSLFAMNYMSGGTLSAAVRLSRGGCVFVLYDRPYLAGSESFYKGKSFCFWKKHLKDKFCLKREVAKLEKDGYRVKSWNLLDEPYYKVVIVERCDSQ